MQGEGQELEAALPRSPTLQGRSLGDKLGLSGHQPWFGLFRLLLPAKVDHKGPDSLSHEDTRN